MALLVLEAAAEVMDGAATVVDDDERRAIRTSRKMMLPRNNSRNSTSTTKRVLCRLCQSLRAAHSSQTGRFSTSSGGQGFSGGCWMAQGILRSKKYLLRRSLQLRSLLVGEARV